MTELDREIRSSGLGASEIAAVCGLSPYTSPLDIYLRKRGLVEDAPDRNPYTTWGLRLEPAIADAYTEETGTLLAGDGRTTYRHKTVEYAIATPDRFAEDARTGLLGHLVEIKTTDSRNKGHWGESGTDNVPEFYLLQATWQMSVMDVDRCDIAVLIGGNDFRIYPIHRDRALEARLLEIGGEFWRNHVLAGEPPLPRDESERGRYLAGLYPQHTGDYIEDDPEIDRLAVALRDLRVTEAELEAQDLRLVNDIKERLGERPGAKGDWGQITYKTTADRSITDYKALLAVLEPDPALVAEYTTTKPGIRRFTPTFKKEVEP